MAKKPTLEDAKNFMLDFYSKNTEVDKDTAWESFLDTVDKTNRKLYEGNQVFQNSVKGYYERLKNENSGTSNEKGSMSKADNLPSIKIEKEIDKAKKEPKTEEPSSWITVQEFMLTLDQLIPDKLLDAALYIDGQQVKSLYGYSVTMPDGKLTVDLLTVR